MAKAVNPFVRFKCAKNEYEEAEKLFLKTVKEWFDKNYKLKDDEDIADFSDAHIKNDDTIIIGYSTCNFETMDKYYKNITDDDGKYYATMEVRPTEIFK